MKIAIDARMARITGIGRYIECLIRELPAPEQKIVALTSPADHTWWSAHYPQIPRQEIPDPIYSWQEQLFLPGRLKGKFDLVHFTNFNVPLAWREPFVVTLHDLTPLHFGGERRTSRLSQRAYQQVLKHAVRSAGRVLVPSQQVRRQLMRWTKADKIAVIPHALAREFTVPKTDPAAVREILDHFGVYTPYFLYVGNMRVHKNILGLLAAFAEFRGSAEKPTSAGLTTRADHQATLVLAGPATPEQKKVLQPAVHALKLASCVVFTGALGNRALVALYDGARAFVLPSFSEGYGLVALEAAARGLPLLASETTPVREFLGRAVLSFNPHKVAQLADLLAMVWHNSALRERYGQLGSSQVRVRTWQQVARETAQQYAQAYSFSKKL